MAIPWDAKAHFLPQIQFLAQSLARGDSPLWSPFVFGGHPQVADPQSLLFSPTYLLLAPLSKPAAREEAELAREMQEAAKTLAEKRA